MNEYVFKPGDTAVITSNDARSETDPEGVKYDVAEGDKVQVLTGPGPDSDGDYHVMAGDGRLWYIAARFLAPADEPAPYYGPCSAGRTALFPWACQNEATEYVEVHTDRTHLMRLCTGHANQAAAYSGFVSRRPLTTPRPRPEPAELPEQCETCETTGQNCRRHRAEAEAAQRAEREAAVPVSRGHGTHPHSDYLCYCGYPKTACAGYAAAVREVDEAEKAAATAPRCTHGADCQLHPQETRLHNYDADPGNLPERVWELEQRVAKLERRLQGVIETHHLWDGS